jgi:hypothetical protein
MSLKAGGKDRLEQRTIDAHLERLKVEVDPETRTVRESSLPSSDVKGGAKGLAKAAAQTGAPDVVDLEDLSALRMRFGVALFEKKMGGVLRMDVEPLARAHIQSTANTLGEAAERIVGLGTGLEKLGRGDTKRLSKLIENVATDLELSVLKEALAHATPEDLNALRHGYADFLSAFRSVGSAFAASLGSDYAKLAGSFERLLAVAPVFGGPKVGSE